MNAAVILDFDRRPSAVPYMVRGIMPVTRHVDLAPQISARWYGHRAKRHELAAFSRIAGLPPAGRTLPLLYPHTFGFRLAMAILTHPRFPVPIWGVLQTRNHLVQHRGIEVDEPLDFETRVMHGRVVPKGAEFDLHTTVHVDAALAWESIVTFFTRGRFGEPGPASPLTRSPSDIGPLAAEWTMRDADHWKFGGFTGDYNGIHMWNWYARRLGFHRALYHPPRVLGECLARLPRGVDARDGRLRLDAWLKGPVPHGATVRMHAATTASAATFALFGEDERPSIVGRLAGLEVAVVGSVGSAGPVASHESVTGVGQPQATTQLQEPSLLETWA
jgi:hypothetical protein